MTTHWFRQVTAFVVSATIASTLTLSTADVASAAALNCSAAPIVVTHSIRLTSDLTCGPNNAFNVQKSGVTIDLNHHTVVSGSAGAFGVFSSGFSRVVVTRGTLSGFGTAVSFSAGSFDTVSRIRAFCSGCTNIEIEINASHSIAKGNFVFSNTRGIQVGGSFNQIVGNVLHANSNGIYITGSHTRVAGNRIVSSGFDGIYDGGGGSFFDGDISSQNGTSGAYDGIDAVSDATAVFKNNVTNYNTKFGIEADPGATDAGGNRGHDNAQATQCLNILCA